MLLNARRRVHAVGRRNWSWFFLLLVPSLLVGVLEGCDQLLLGPEAENTPLSNFDILWKAFDENYPLFTVKHINWDSLRVVYRSQISSTTCETALWDITAALLLHLNDGHVKLFSKGYTHGVSGSPLNFRKADDFSLGLIEGKFINGMKTAGDNLFVYGTLKPSFSAKSIGYLHVGAFVSAASKGDAWAYEIDKVVRDLGSCDAMIIDLRNNGGGTKLAVTIIAAPFVDRAITYFYQREKMGPGHDDFGEPIPLTVTPREGAPQFTKSIALLTNRFSASGSEHFAEIFKHLPYATQIGDTTFGAFGDIINNAQLPNGWGYSYPCRLTLRPDGTCPEGLGILPAMLVENTAADITAGNDNVMAAAIEHLSR